jgi:hypothetical protein
MRFIALNFPPVSTTQVTNLPPLLTTPVENFSTDKTGDLDIGGKLATSVNNPVGKFAADVNDTGANCHWYQGHRRQICHVHQ